jgi:hypothetical protein
MDGPGYQFLSGTRLAFDQHRGIGSGDPLGQLFQFDNLGTVSDEGVEVELGSKFFFELNVFPGYLFLLQGLFYGDLYLVHPERLGYVIQGTVLEGLYG